MKIAEILGEKKEVKMDKLEKIKFVKKATECSTVEAEVALDDNNWDVDAAVVQILDN